LNINENSIFSGLFWKNLSNICNILRNPSFKSCYFKQIFKENLSIFIFEDLAFLKLLKAKFGLLNIFGPGNPATQTQMPELSKSL